MKKTSLVLSVLALTFSASSFAGGVSSNGPVGRLLMNCEGGIHFSRDNMAEVYVKVLPVMGQGLMAFFSFSPEARIPAQAPRKVEKKADPRGTVFQGSKIDILVPNMQNPNRQQGHFNAVLNLPEFSSYAVTLDCTQN